jgi:cell wall-associated NlpC family hydrolase
MIFIKKVKFLLPVMALFNFFTAIQELKGQFLSRPDSCQPASFFSFPSGVNHDGISSMREEIIRVARQYLGIRYRSSGKNPKAGFDCSGFTGFVFRKMGIPLRASSPAQAMEGKKVPSVNARKGDLAFFGHRGRKGRYHVNHAAIVISEPGEPLAIIHSASRKGIVITRVNEDPYWRKSLLFVKSVL